MAANERIKKYLEAGTVFGQVTRARAEEIVKELVSGGDIQRGQAQEWVDNLVDRSRKTSEQVLELVRHEVSAQLSRIDSSAVENLANQVADILKRSAEAGRSATAGATTQATNRAQSVRKSATKSAKSATKTAKSTATNTAKAARKAAESVSPSGRKKTPAKKATSASAPKKTAAKKAAAKKTATKKTAAKKTAAKKTAARRPARADQAPEQRASAAARYRARSARPGRHPDRSARGHHLWAGGRVRNAGGQGGSPGCPERARRGARTAGPLRQPRWREARRSPDPVRHRRDGSARARCRRINRRLHPLPPPARGRDGLRGGRRPRPAGPAHPDRPSGHRAGEGQRSLLDARGAEPGGPGLCRVFDRHGRPLLHLAGHRGSRPHRTRRHRPGRPGSSGQAPVRGRESRRGPGEGRRPGPRRVA